MKIEKGYKVFNPDWTCKGLQYKLGEITEISGDPKCCKNGLHYCKELANCFNYYNFNPKNKVAEIEALGKIDEDGNGKYCTNKIRIVRELSWEEVLRLCNIGIGNSGYCNSGNRNSGDYNSGEYNSGEYNSGDRNSGDCNSGDYNSGNRNSGNRNSGNRNSGDYNSGYFNSGNYNSGECNIGDFNSGYCNSGDRNSGDCNSGNRNSGYCNSGNRNSGNRNSGDYNSGYFNSGNRNSGYFNSDTPKVRLFNHETNLDFDSKEICRLNAILNSCPQSYRYSRFIWKENMTEEEIKRHPECETIGGYIKNIVIKADKQKWWEEEVSYRDKEFIKSLPHFDSNIFYTCVGVRI